MSLSLHLCVFLTVSLCVHNNSSRSTASIASYVCSSTYMYVASVWLYMAKEQLVAQCRETIYMCKLCNNYVRIYMKPYIYHRAGNFDGGNIDRLASFRS